MNDIVWKPDSAYKDTSRVADFMRQHRIATWQELLKRSREDNTWFWHAALAHLGIEWFTPYRRLYDASGGMPWTKWFIGGTLNIAHNCLDRHVRDGKGARIALREERDNGVSRAISYQELFDIVETLVSAMRHAGIRHGDRIAICMTISVEAVAVMLACFKVGASCMQVPARLNGETLANMLAPGNPKMLFIHDGYCRAGSVFDLSETERTLAARLPTLKRVIVVNRIGRKGRPRKYATGWATFLENTDTQSDGTAILDAEAEALVLYSSGTTGTPKAIVHTHGGILAQVAKEIGYAFDCKENDVFYWFTNIGWMMAPWEIIGSLFFGASVVLYEGTHLYPTPHRVFELIEKYGITIFGFTPTALRGLRSLGEDFSTHHIDSLRIGIVGGMRCHSIVAAQNRITFVFTESAGRDLISEHVSRHGDSVKDVAFQVDDAKHALAEAERRGARIVVPLQVMQSDGFAFRWGSIAAYGDVVHSFIERKVYPGFAPGYMPVRLNRDWSSDISLLMIDHVVANVENMNEWAEFYQRVFGFIRTHHFDIRTPRSALMSFVVEDTDGYIKLPINEPYQEPGGSVSQIQEYLDDHRGPGVQHIALLTNNIIPTIAEMHARGVKLLDTPDAYYDMLSARVGAIPEDLALLKANKILVDRETPEGYLLQIFANGHPFFEEIIQRKGNAVGFGHANFQALFEAIEREQDERARQKAETHGAT